MPGYSVAGRNAALSGVIGLGDHLSLHTADPGTTGAAEGAGVARIAAGWAAPGNGTVDSTEVPFAIPAGGGTRVYTHFGVSSELVAGTFVTSGLLDEPETFSDNGGTYNFTATLTAATAP